MKRVSALIALAAVLTVVSFSLAQPSIAMRGGHEVRNRRLAVYAAKTHRAHVRPTPTPCATPTPASNATSTPDPFTTPTATPTPAPSPFVTSLPDPTPAASPSPSSAPVSDYGANVRDYGARGDGFSDDTAAFKAACSAVAAAGGGTVYVPAGVYKISTFTIPDGIGMAGEGMDASIVAGTFLYSSNDAFTGLQIGADGVSLRSLKDANNSNVHDTQFKSCRFVGGPAAISFVDRRASNITFSDCVIQPNFAQSGDGVAIVERGTATMHFENIEFIGCHFMGASMFNFECIQRDPYDGYPVITGYRNINLIDCVFEPSAGQSISYDSNSLVNGQPCSGYSTVQGCLIKGAGADSANRWPHGLEFNGAGHMVCKNNTFYSCRGSLLNLHGDKVHNDTSPGIAISITGNTFDMTKGIAHDPSRNLVMSGGSGVLIANNTFTVNSGSEFFLLTGPHNLIENNTVTDLRPTSNCFLVYLDGAPNNAVKGNTFRAVHAYVRVLSGSSGSTFDSNTFVTGLTESSLYQIAAGETINRINNVYE